METTTQFDQDTFGRWRPGNPYRTCDRYNCTRRVIDPDHPGADLQGRHRAAIGVPGESFLCPECATAEPVR